MDMASQNDSSKHGSPFPDRKLPGPGRFLQPDRNPDFAFSAPPCSPPFHCQDRPLTSPPMFRNTLLPEQRRRHFQNNSYIATNTTTSTTSSLDKTKTCLTCTILFLVILNIFCIPVLIFYFVGPHSSTFTVEQVTFHYPIFYNSSSSTRFSSLFDINMKVNNPARHIGVFYEYDNSIVATYSGIRLCSGGIPPFYQPPKDEMLVQSHLTCLRVILPDHIKQKLEHDNRNQRVPLTLSMMGTVRFKMWSVTLGALLRVSCKIILDNLNTSTPELISSACDSAAGFLFAAIRN
ncbi:hypothetical protein DITRI_Ditri07aG0041500 [Diplodiscus trichospermus]